MRKGHIQLNDWFTVAVSHDPSGHRNPKGEAPVPDAPRIMCSDMPDYIVVPDQYRETSIYIDGVKQ